MGVAVLRGTTVSVLVTEALGRDRARPLEEGKREHKPDFRWCRR